MTQVRQPNTCESDKANDITEMAKMAKQFDRLSEEERLYIKGALDMATLASKRIAKSKKGA
ncbi:hypothetical protein RWV98_02790 [Agathobaculum sp. NTUH-O15-33]|uniref:hypothetical protein n=1 Tax=Agathobaculum sp. NTUH-O15-33 TaxID=3079302 RepID=UPI0029585859|nr:hypothetical protein [Agathobaculum sp. NTUH-O15-33]WNX85219.1 hypothetical protein RWV98_02790 [Agathobaculum sp. NTUH-O15-33]